MSTAPSGEGALLRNAVHVSGNPAGAPMVFAHGFGGSQEAWAEVVPEFEPDHMVVVYDHVGSGHSDVSLYDPGKYDSLYGYADDLLEILEELDLSQVIFVGHSVGAMIGLLAANREPERFSKLVMVGPSPKYVDENDYVGGASREAIDELLDSLDSNYFGWSSAMAPAIIGNPERPELGLALTESFQTVDPIIASQFARVTFLSDNRRDLPDVTVPTLILQSKDDVIAPEAVGEYMHQKMPGSEYVLMDARGHVPNVSEPAEVARHIRSYLA